MDEPSIKEPSALLPLIMSFVAIAIVVGHAAVFGIVHEADEGTPAHIFQLLIALQVPIVAFFAVKWLPQAPKQALLILSLQAAAVIAAFAGVYFLT
jgi:drug/metabolite transporter (DMT)-like permease